MNFKDKAEQPPGTKQVEELREELRRRTARETAEYSWQLEVVDRLIDLLQMDPSEFRRQWIVPLLDAGVSLEIATGCIVQSYLQPN